MSDEYVTPEMQIVSMEHEVIRTSITPDPDETEPLGLW